MTCYVYPPSICAPVPGTQVDTAPTPSSECTFGTHHAGRLYHGIQVTYGLVQGCGYTRRPHGHKKSYQTGCSNCGCSSTGVPSVVGTTRPTGLECALDCRRITGGLKCLGLAFCSCLPAPNNQQPTMAEVFGRRWGGFETTNSSIDQRNKRHLETRQGNDRSAYTSPPPPPQATDLLGLDSLVVGRQDPSMVCNRNNKVIIVQLEALNHITV
jgi:hypothetical protein